MNQTMTYNLTPCKHDELDENDFDTYCFGFLARFVLVRVFGFPDEHEHYLCQYFLSVDISCFVAVTLSSSFQSTYHINIISI